MNILDEQNFWSNLEQILRANINFVIKGDKSDFIKLLKNNDLTSLNNYVEKYDKVFKADYRWTIHNYDNIYNDDQHIILNEWYNKTKVINDKFNLGLQTVDDFVLKVDLKKDLVTEITNIILDNYIKPVFTTNKIIQNNDQLTKAFSRYIIGQSYIFFKYHYINYSATYFNKILNYIMNKNKITPYDITIVRAFYDKFIDLCVDDSVISDDNAVNYKEVYPIMEPFAVSYDISGNKSLGEIYLELTK